MAGDRLGGVGGLDGLGEGVRLVHALQANDRQHAVLQRGRNLHAVVHERGAALAGIDLGKGGLERGLRGIRATIRRNHQAVRRNLDVGEACRGQVSGNFVGLIRGRRIIGDELIGCHLVLHHRQRRYPGRGQEGMQLVRIAQLQRNLDVDRLRGGQRAADHITLAQRGGLRSQYDKRLAADRVAGRGADRHGGSHADGGDQQLETKMTWHLELPK